MTDTETAPAGCALGRPLGDCALHRAGCGSLYAVLCYLYPPAALVAELRNRQHLDPEATAWLDRLEAAKPRPMHRYSVTEPKRTIAPVKRTEPAQIRRRDEYRHIAP
jgi:hypothetical protein